MSDYSKSYDGAAKDAAQSTVTGADFDTEFDAIETASATKSNKNKGATSGNLIEQDANGDLVDSGVAVGAVTTTELGYVAGVTSSIQTQLDAKADTLAFRGCQVRHTLDHNPDSGVLTTFLFNTDVYDTDSIHSTSTNTGRLTVPSGVTKVKISGGFVYGSDGTGYTRGYIYKGTTDSYYGSPHVYHHRSQTTDGAMILTTPVLEVIGGNYFELKVKHSESGTMLVGSTGLWFAMEIIE